MPRPRERQFNQGVREKPEFEQKLLDIRRVARVVAGGRRFSFRTTVVLGNRLGKVGVGVAKGADVSSATEKAVHRAKKRMITINLTSDESIPYTARGKYASSEVVLKPARRGHGLVAGGAVRVVCDLAGIRNISSKILSRTANKLNNAMATIDALKKIRN
jgi:small subunit ribosomal protein S5